MADYNAYGSKGGIRLPSVKDTAIETTVELLALADYVFQSTGTLEAISGAQDLSVGHVMAIKTSTGKYVVYNQAGSGGAEVAKGFLRIAASTEAGAVAAKDQACEVVIGGAVKNALVIAASNWHSGVLTDLKARQNTVADALIF
jgi:hypothetical protein